MVLVNFSPNTIIKSADVNSNLSGLADGSLDATANSLAKTRKQAFTSFVVSGMTMSTSGTLSSVLSAGEAYVNGKYVSVALQTITFAASKDTYLYLKDDGTLVQNAVANNASSPSATTNSDGSNALLLLIAVSSGSAITTINQGSSGATLPTTVNTNGRGQDSNGVNIYSTSPIVGARLERQTLYSATGNGATLGTGRYMYIGDMLIQTGSFYVNNGFTGWTNVGVTFAKGFSELPVVTICSTSPVADSEADNSYPCSVRALAVGSYQARVYHGNSTIGGGYNWIAIGKA